MLETGRYVPPRATSVDETEPGLGHYLRRLSTSAGVKLLPMHLTRIMESKLMN